MLDELSDGLSERNCGCGSGVYVLMDPYYAKCGVCNSTKLTQLGLNRAQEKERAKMLAKMQAERDAYNAEHPGEV